MGKSAFGHFGLKFKKVGMWEFWEFWESGNSGGQQAGRTFRVIILRSVGKRTL